MRDLVLSASTLSNPLPLSLEMQMDFLTYLKSGSLTASSRKAATSARLMGPASPSMTLTMPLGSSDLRPPGRMMQNSRSLPGLHGHTQRNGRASFGGGELEQL